MRNKYRKIRETLTLPGNGGEPITPDADEEWGKQNSLSFSNPDTQWAELQKCPPDASPVNNAPNPDDE